jgi:hypothetical protein
MILFDLETYLELSAPIVMVCNRIPRIHLVIMQKLNPWVSSTKSFTDTTGQFRFQPVFAIFAMLFVFILFRHIRNGTWPDLHQRAIRWARPVDKAQYALESIPNRDD